MGAHPAYLTFYIDFLDPAFAPGTGTPVAGGLSSAQALGILRGLGSLNFVGMDVVEVAPAYDHAEITAIAAATIDHDFIGLLAQKRLREAALLKVFGASRSAILRLYATEFAAAAGIAALAGTAIGVSASWPIVTYVFEATWSLPWQPAAWVMGAATAVSAAGGAMVGLSTLSRTPADALRTA